MNPSDKDTLNTLSHVIKDEIIFVQVNNKDGKWRATRNNNCGYGATKKKAESDLLELERFMRITKKL